MIYNHLYCVSVLTLTPARTYINIQINDEAPMEAKIKFNVVYSYDVIIETAKEVQSKLTWQSNEQVKNLQLSSSWVRGMLNRASLRRRKITREDKVIPSINVIKAILRIGQDMCLAKGHDENTIFNMDETAYTWAVGPTHLYVPCDQERASNLGVANTKLRITAVITVGANGAFAPLMIIIKHSVCSKVRPDQSRMKVIKDLFRRPDFGERNGWRLVLWEKTMQVGDKMEDHKCWYMTHDQTNHVITSQHKAWNDQVRMTMWLELIMLPIKMRLGKLLIWFDNCGCHKTAIVQDYIEEIGIDVAYLPPNMTAIL